jgi:short-subunit dehydrogenase
MQLSLSFLQDFAYLHLSYGSPRPPLPPCHHPTHPTHQKRSTPPNSPPPARSPASQPSSLAAPPASAKATSAPRSTPPAPPLSKPHSDPERSSFFSEAAKLAPDGRVAHVIANAGIHKPDSAFSVDVSKPPTRPEFPILEVNVLATLYTVKLALWYFVRQNGTVPSPEQRDTSLTLIGSGSSFLDLLRTPQYAGSKWFQRGVFRSLRRTAHVHGTRVNMIAPWYVRTGILSAEAFDEVKRSEVQIARMEDAQRALLTLVAGEANKRVLFVSPRKWRDERVWDLGIDDYEEMGREDVEIVQGEQMLGDMLENGLFT